MEQIENKSSWLRSPAFADVFEGRDSLQSLEPASEVIGCDEVREMLSKLLMALVVEALDCGFLDGPVHSFNLAVGPRMLWFGQPMIDIVSRAGEFKSVSTEERPFCDSLFNLANSQATAAWYREVNTIIGENRMDFVGHGRDKMAKEFGGNLGGRFLMQLDKGEFRRSIDGDKEMELAFLGSHFGNVDVEEADRVSFELLLRRLAPLDIWQLADAVALKQRCREDRVRCGMVGCSAYRQSSSGNRVCRRKATMIASSSIERTVDFGSFGPVGRSATELRWRHLATVFGLIP